MFSFLFGAGNTAPFFYVKKPFAYVFTRVIIYSESERQT